MSRIKQSAVIDKHHSNEAASLPIAKVGFDPAKSPFKNQENKYRWSSVQRWEKIDWNSHTP